MSAAILASVPAAGVGARAQNWLRQEKSYRAFGNELGRDATPLEAALDRFVDLSKDFRGKQAMLDKGIRSLCVTLLIDGDPLKDSKGREIGTMTADSFLENSGREIYQYQYATLTLYFANEAGDHLVKETRRVPYSTNIPLERVVVEQLMKGPKEDGHYAVLPDTMNVLSVTTSDRIAYVNFDKSFKDSALSSVAEQIPIYAVVDSITANCKVDKVQFSINGESDVTFRETMKLNQFYEEDLSYLEEKDT